MFLLSNIEVKLDKVRVQDDNSVTGWVTKTISSDLFKHHNCNTKMHNWGSTGDLKIEQKDWKYGALVCSDIFE